MRYLKYLWAVILLMVISFILYPKIKDPFSQIPLMLKEANILLLIPMFIFQALFYVSNGWLYKRLLAIAGFNLKLKDTIKIALLGSLGNQFVPIVGGISATWIFYRKYKIPSSVIVFSVTAWLILIVLNYILFFVASLPFLPKEFLVLIPAKVSFAILVGIILLLICGYLLLKNEGKTLLGIFIFFAQYVNRFTNYFIIKKALIRSEKLEHFVLGFHKNLKFLLTHKTKLPQIILASTLLHLCDILTLYVAFLVFGFQPNIATLIFGLSLAAVVNYLSPMPETPGVMEASLAAVFTAIGLPFHISLFSSLLFRLFSYWLSLPFVLLFYIRPKKALE